MFANTVRRNIVRILILTLALSIVGPLPQGVLAADNQVQLEASGTGEALLVTGLIISGIFLIARSVREKNRERHYTQGRALLDQGDYDAAVSELEQAGKYKDAPVHLARAKEAACADHYQQAAQAISERNLLSAYRHLKKIKDINPDYRDVPDLYARVRTWLKPLLTVRLAVLDFDNSSGYNLGSQASSLMINEIVNEDLEFVEVAERVELNQILREQRLWGSDYFEPNNVKRVGQLLGVNYLVVGEVLEANSSTNTTYTIITDDDKVKVRYRMEREAHVSATFRVINVDTGTVVVSDSASRRARDADYSYWRWGFGNLDSESELIHEALDHVIEQFSNKLLKFLEQEVNQGLEGSFRTTI